MSEPRSATPRQTMLVGAATVAGGLYLLLVGASALPVPGGPGNLHGPLGLVLCIGIAVCLAGIALLLQAFGRANGSGELPVGASRWMRVAQYLIGVAIFACLASVGSWVAFGSGPREFSGSLMLFGVESDAIIGRIMFGFGAVIAWLCTLLFAVYGARRLLRRDAGRSI